MPTKKQVTLFLLMLLFGGPFLFTQTTPFSKGVNLTNWFQASSPGAIQFSKYTKKDFEQIKSLGFDVIRLPINLHFMTNGAPDYVVDPLFLSFLDQAVDWAEELNMHLILDNHTFDPATATDPAVGDILKKVWPQMATHYRDRSELLYYEVLNEPHGISDFLWNNIQQEVVKAIRAVDNKHTIIIGPASWNSYNNLAAMPIYADDNLIYTFHFYDPFIFTHQGASWVSPSMEPLTNVPFPYDNNRMPALPGSLNNTWIGNSFNNYEVDGTVAKVQELIDIAVEFSASRGVPVFCGEFGVYQPNSQEEDRVFWYEQIRAYLEEKGISWTMWDYHGGFGLFEEGSDGFFDHHLNVPLLRALDLMVPTQTEFVKKPDTLGFNIYTDFIENGVEESSYGEGQLDYFSSELPNNGQYCIKWEDSNQYGAIGFDIKPNKDMSYLVDNNFALDLFVRSDNPGTSFDIRFLDSNTEDPEDRPWRMGATIGPNQVSWDGQWQHLHIPLDDMLEKGAWENAWFNPIGAYDWSEVDRLEIVAEQGPLTNVELWFDQIIITDMDTAMVNPITSVTLLPSTINLNIYPNPSIDQLIVTSTSTEAWTLEVFNSNGQVLQRKFFYQEVHINTSHLPKGAYWLRLKDENRVVKTIPFQKQD